MNHKTSHSNQRLSTTNPIKIGCERRCPGRVGSSCFTFGIAIVAATKCFFFLRNLHVTDYDQQRSLSYCNLTILHHKGTPIHHPDMQCVLDHGNRHQYPVWFEDDTYHNILST